MHSAIFTAGRARVTLLSRLAAGQSHDRRLKWGLCEPQDRSRAVKRLITAPAALLLTATIAMPCAAQQIPSTPLSNQDCVGCFAYLEFPPPLEPESYAMRGQVIEPGATLPAADEPSDRVREHAKMTNLAGPERCPAALVDVTAESREERHLACSAARDAIGLLDRCGISPHSPLALHISSDVRHPLGGAIFGLLDTKQEKVLVTQETNIPSLVKDTPY